MFGLFSKKTEGLTDKSRKRLSNQSIAWEILVDFNRDETLTHYHMITGQKPITFEELQDFHRLYSFNKNKKNEQNNTQIETKIFTSKMFKEYLRTYPHYNGYGVNSYDFLKYILSDLSGIKKSLFEGYPYFNDATDYKSDDSGVFWSYLDDKRPSDDIVPPLAYILLHTHETSKEYHSLCFENIHEDIHDDVYESKSKGYSLLDSSKPMHFVKDFSIKNKDK